MSRQTEKMSFFDTLQKQSQIFNNKNRGAKVRYLYEIGFSYDEVDVMMFNNKSLKKYESAIRNKEITNRANKI